ncbi:hypothetical protein D3P06_19025 [Paracoccus aestuarii]|uniref:Uncharacterized protein n=1 Tax=Paracoccus aestuarii TaxID=453842 RepID=A0A418ZP10_9RHOB|nr:hypothetical protein [Paracoccus aestuarii]RJK92909.1 hypothetical protein D3P06_19025 [Paracoccus aestuarii]WCQ99852.1 hypothetical protein JHW48_03745 [Paracoccus aestuarii]
MTITSTTTTRRSAIPLPALLLPALLLPGAVTAAPYLGRCQMGECIHVDQVSRQVVGEGSAAVPGDLVMVALRTAVPGAPEADPATLDWEAPAPVQFFCSEIRPAFRSGDGSYQGLDLVTPVGATTLVTAMYLHACHPEAEIGENLFAAAAALGYGATSTEVFADLNALTAR